MYIVETALRPARLALAYSTSPSTRVLRRAFRLLGGRWGGRFDVMLCVDAAADIDPFSVGVLAAADPDFLLVIDPVLDAYDWAPALSVADRQPFHILRFKERMETGNFGWLFRTQPTPVDSDVPSTSVLDVERRGLNLRLAAYSGLVPTRATFTRVKTREGHDWITPVDRSAFGLRSIASEARWGVFGNFDDPRCAARFWSIRALGGRPFWRRPGSLKAKGPPPSLRRARSILLTAPDISHDELEATASRWTNERRGVDLAPDNPAEVLLETADVDFASQVIPVAEHKGYLRLATPPLPNPRGQPVRRRLTGVAEFRIRSPDAHDPDGLILTRGERSRLLISAGLLAPSRRRVTRAGIGEVVEMASSQLIQLPLPTYRDAVSAPFVDAGYTVGPSDKGQYQQRTLALARGLVFLTWMVRQPESARLLELFFTYHLPAGNPPPEYRRAVEYRELREELHAVLRERRDRLRRPLLDRADLWLKSWAEALLDRGIIKTGYVLACKECSARTWYAAELVDQRFHCVRCGHRASLSPTVQLSFRLSEAVYQFIAHHGQVVTLALARLRAEAKESFLYLPETSLDDGTSTREIDAAALLDGRLVIVEAKSNARIADREIDWYKHLARVTRAGRLAFATTAEAWEPTTDTRLAALRAALAEFEIGVEALVKSDLIPADVLELEPFIRRPAE